MRQGRGKQAVPALQRSEERWSAPRERPGAPHSVEAAPGACPLEPRKTLPGEKRCRAEHGTPGGQEAPESQRQPSADHRASAVKGAADSPVDSGARSAHWPAPAAQEQQAPGVERQTKINLAAIGQPEYAISLVNQADSGPFQRGPGVTPRQARDTRAPDRFPDRRPAESARASRSAHGSAEAGMSCQPLVPPEAKAANTDWSGQSDDSAAI